MTSDAHADTARAMARYHAGHRSGRAAAWHDDRGIVALRNACTHYGADPAYVQGFVLGLSELWVAIDPATFVTPDRHPPMTYRGV